MTWVPPPHTGRWNSAFTPGLGKAQGLPALGHWTFEVRDTQFEDHGVLNGAVLHLLATDLCLGVPASASSYGQGLGGAQGAPVLSLSAAPVLVAPFDVQLSNPRGVVTPGWLAIGLAPASIPLFGGTLLVAAPNALSFAVPAAGYVLPVVLPFDLGACGQRVYAQAALLDASAPQGVALSQGLELVLGS